MRDRQAAGFSLTGLTGGRLEMKLPAGLETKIELKRNI